MHFFKIFGYENFDALHRKLMTCHHMLNFVVWQIKPLRYSSFTSFSIIRCFSYFFIRAYSTLSPQ